MKKLNRNTALRGFVPVPRMRGFNIALRRTGKTANLRHLFKPRGYGHRWPYPKQIDLPLDIRETLRALLQTGSEGTR